MKLITAVLSLITLFLIACTSVEEKKSPKKIEVAAVYYPHWHTYPDGEKNFGKGWTEWENVKTTIPRFKNHKFIKEPLLGYIDGKNPNDVEKEIELASNCGIDVFLFDWYWYDGTLIMKESLEQAFLKAKNTKKMKFAIMWAYHDRYGKLRIDPKIAPAMRLLAKTPEEFLEALTYCVDNYFGLENYWRVDGKPFFCMYEVDFFIKNMGGPAKTKKLLATIDAMMKKKGLPPVHWNGMCSKKASIASIKEAGFETITTYVITPWHVPTHDERTSKREFIFDYSEIMQAHKRVWDDMSSGDLPYMPIVTRGWDCSARCALDTPFPWVRLDYPLCGVVVNNTPDRYKEILQDAKDFAEKNPEKHPAILLNAWNEYTEGSYLLPDMRDGDASLRAIAEVFSRKPSNVYVCSDTETKQMLQIPKATYENYPYGVHHKQRMDVWLADDNNKKRPTIVYVHGGGWNSGGMIDRHIASALPTLLKNGVNVVCLDYRFLQDAIDDEIKNPMDYPLTDGVYAIKYLVGMEKRWNIDLDKLAVVSVSNDNGKALKDTLEDKLGKVDIKIKLFENIKEGKETPTPNFLDIVKKLK